MEKSLEGVRVKSGCWVACSGARWDARVVHACCFLILSRSLPRRKGHSSHKDEWPCWWPPLGHLSPVVVLAGIWALAAGTVGRRAWCTGLCGLVDAATVVAPPIKHNHGYPPSGQRPVNSSRA